jgi:hypothetical protein
MKKQPPPSSNDTKLHNEGLNLVYQEIMKLKNRRLKKKLREIELQKLDAQKEQKE